MSRSMRKKNVFLPYDFDTAIGINNEGSLVFSYNLEDIDQTAVLEPGDFSYSEFSDFSQSGII